MNVQVQRRADLDFVRGVAILMALGWHFNARDTGFALVDLLMLPGRTLGWAGVDLFFVLSGFLVGGLILKEARRTGAFEARRFLVRRAFKIWPVLYLYIALLVLTGRYPWWQVVPQTLLHLQNFWRTPLNHLWSLAVEEHFYVAVAVLMAWLGSRGVRGFALLPRLLVVVIVAAAALRFAGTIAGLDRITLQTQTQFRIDSLAVGLLLANLHVMQPERFAALAARKWTLLLLGIVSAAALVMGRESPPFIATLGYIAAYTLGACLLLLVFDVPAFNGGNRAARLLSWIGSYSYPIYVLQFVPFRAAEAAWKALVGTPMSVATEVGVKYLGAILIGVIVARAVERPMISLRNRLFPSRWVPA